MKKNCTYKILLSKDINEYNNVSVYSDRLMKILILKDNNDIIDVCKSMYLMLTTNPNDTENDDDADDQISKLC